MIDYFQYLLASFTDSWLALMLLLIIGTFILEDAAVISGAYLATEAYLSIPLTLCALFIGIVVGDYGLYGLGYAAKKYDWAKRHLKRNGVERFQVWLLDNVWFALFSSRFVPGMRLPVYTLSGALAVPPLLFGAVILIGNVIWVPLLFFTLYYTGSSLSKLLGPYAWIAWLVPVLFLFFFNQLMKRLVTKKW